MVEMKSDEKLLTWDCVIEADSIDFKIALDVEEWPRADEKPV